MPPTPQSVLLRFLETGSFVRVGGTNPVRSDLRVIAASNVPIEELSGKNLIRSDLLYRLNCLVIEIAPLRERRSDIRRLAEKCLREDLHYLGAVDEECRMDMNTDNDWEEWGRRDPYFGVITDPKFRSGKITEDAKREFLASGESHVHGVLATIRKHIDPGFAPRTTFPAGARAIIQYHDGDPGRRRVDPHLDAAFDRMLL